MKVKQEIILMHIRDGKSQREISRITGKDRKTIRKYIEDYERSLIECKGIDAEEPKLLTFYKKQGTIK